MNFHCRCPPFGGKFQKGRSSLPCPCPWTGQRKLRTANQHFCGLPWASSTGSNCGRFTWSRTCKFSWPAYSQWWGPNLSCRQARELRACNRKPFEVSLSWAFYCPPLARIRAGALKLRFACNCSRSAGVACRFFAEESGSPIALLGPETLFAHRARRKSHPSKRSECASFHWD